MVTKLAFVTYETPFAPAGGIAAVMGRLPACVQQASGLETIVLTPFHHKIARTTALQTEDAGQVVVTYGNAPLDVRLERYHTEVSWCFLQPQNVRFFAGTPHPYLVGATPEDIAQHLLRDALVFGTCVVAALQQLDAEAQWVLFLQDWEAATTALACSRAQSAWRLFLTLHNSYDSPVADADLHRHGISAAACPGVTVLNRAIPLIENTLFTVSDQFADDLTQDDFQSQVMADHLQDVLRPRILGVNNGPFVDLAVAPKALARAQQGDFQLLAAWKAANRHQAIAALKALTPSPEQPIWGDLRRFRQDASACWFVMAGRDDTRQKGYDVAAAGIRRFLSLGKAAQFFFFPIPGDEGLAGLCFLKKLAEEFPEHIVVCPFIWREGFFATLQGASFGLMPSLYEPFGMANEFYLNGTVGIGRATGGIVQQIVPIQRVACFSHAAQACASRWHSSSAHPTGLLFRESVHSASAVQDWRAMNAANYRLGGASPDRVEQRNGYGLFRAMSDELRISLEDAVDLFHNESEQYYAMLTEGIAHVQRAFSWQRAAHEYVRTVVLI
jgi:glycogen synthase